MVGDPLVTLTLLFSIIAGTAACILSVLNFEILRRSPFGRAVFALSVVLSTFVVYHVLLVLMPGNVLVSHAAKSVTFTSVTAFVWLMVWSQYRLRRHEGPAVEP